MEIYIIIPTIRNVSFLRDWQGEFSDCHLIIVEDHSKKEIESPQGTYKSVHHYTWEDIQHDFGRDEWIFPRKNSGIRSFGFFKAYALGADIIITLDDDCYPVDKHFIQTHVSHLQLSAPERWSPTYPHRDFVFTRGIPYGVRGKRPVVVSHGLWTHNIDLDAQTQIKHPDVHLPPYPPMVQFIPPGSYFPLCSMNYGFAREVTPLMYFPLMGTDARGNLWGYDRFDDIWAGIFAKKIIDHLGLSVVNGSPFVEHRKASNVLANLKKEKTGIETNEHLWLWVDAVKLTERVPARCYAELAQKIKFPNAHYFSCLREAMIIWAKRFV